MKRLSLAVAAFVGLAQATQDAGHGGSLKSFGSGYKGGKGLKSGNDHHHGINYDYTCEAQHLEHCLYNDIQLYGPNVVLVNLDNRCQVEKYEHEGIFLQTGDLLFVTGRESTCSWQHWDEPDCAPLDYDVLFPGLDYDMPLITDKGSRQNIVVLEAVGTGQTSYEIQLSWGGEVVRDVNLDVYVDMQPGLTVATPRFSC
eukprot:403353033